MLDSSLDAWLANDYWKNRLWKNLCGQGTCSICVKIFILISHDVDGAAQDEARFLFLFWINGIRIKKLQEVTTYPCNLWCEQFAFCLVYCIALVYFHCTTNMARSSCNDWASIQFDFATRNTGLGGSWTNKSWQWTSCMEHKPLIPHLLPLIK